MTVWITRSSSIPAPVSPAPDLYPNTRSSISALVRHLAVPELATAVRRQGGPYLVVWLYGET